MEFEAYRLHSAIRDGNDSVALEILMGQDSKTVEQIAEAYQQIFKKQLSDCVKYNEKLLSAPILHVILTEARNDARDPVNDELFLVDPINLTRDAKFMIATPMDEWLSLDTTFVRLIGHENFAHIHAVLKALELDSGHTIEEILNSRKCADFRKKEILLLIIKLVKNQPEYFARRFQDIFMVTQYSSRPAANYTQVNQWFFSQNQRQENEDISDLIILLLSRCERDLKSIKVAYEDLYEDDTLGNAVNRCVPSKFKQFVTSIVDGN